MVEPLRFLSEAGDGVWAVNTAQRIILWNHAAEDLLGYTPQNAIGQFCYHLLAGRNTAGKTVCRSNCAVIERVRRGESPRGFGLLVRHHNGPVARISVSIVVIPGAPEADQPVAIAHIFRKPGATVDGPLPLRICLLGTAAVWRMDGSPVSGPYWQRARVRALLALLALRRGQPVRREVVLETLWPHLRRPAALHNLNTTVYDLRRSLEPGLERASDSSYICNGGNSYWLADSLNHWLDVEAFEVAIAQAHKERSPERAIQRYRKALDLYSGEFMDDLGDTLEWCCRVRQRQRELYLTALEALGGLYGQQHQYALAAEVYRRALDVEPCQEIVCQRLMRLSLRRGDRVTAVVHYRRLAEALEHELEMSPGEETQSIYEEAMRGS
jgi:PAS domain S-box-containing protein